MALSLSDWGPLGPWGEAGSWEALPGQVHIDSAQKYGLGKGAPQQSCVRLRGLPVPGSLAGRIGAPPLCSPLPGGLAGHFT